MADGVITIIKPHASAAQAMKMAQAEFPIIGKTAQGQRSKYATLDKVIDTLRPILNKNGLVVLQPTFVVDNYMMVRTVLLHESGDKIEGDAYPVAPFGKTPQEFGSALTYARRYALLSLCGVHPSDEDDDGEEASKCKSSAATPEPTRATISPTSAPSSGSDMSKVKAYVDSLIAGISAASDMEELERIVDRMHASAAWKKLTAHHAAQAERVQQIIAMKLEALRGEELETA